MIHPWPQDLALDNALWQFAGRCWALPGLRKQALHLQSLGCSVNALLAAAWCTEQCIDWDGRIPATLARWHANQVGPLREIRQSLPDKTTPYTALYQALLSAELAAEQLELAAWHDWLVTLPRRPADNDYSLQQQLAILDNLVTPQTEGFTLALLDWHTHLKHDWIPQLSGQAQSRSADGQGRSKP